MANKYLTSGFLFLILGVGSAKAVPPVSIDQYADVPWSVLQNNPFDGKLVYDKHFDDHFAFVTMWSPSGIKATYTSYWREQVDWRYVWKSRYIWKDGKRIEERYREREAVYERRSSQRIPKALLFAINGQVYRYESGAVPPDLARALATAPAGNMLIRVVWDNDQTWDAPIGEGTVATWRTVFSSP